MSISEPEKLSGTSLDISAENRSRLKELFPTVFTETVNDKGELVESVDFEKLKAELGTFTDLFESRRERYGMDWPGKKEALRLIQTPSYATLKPCREESVNFDTTENLFIEGDNLEVLKLLQKSYYGKVKMIYIDPPYNTGNEFIYPDNYTESLETYLEYAGLIDGEGKKFSTNTTNEGRFHTKWLNMMYPRLYLARNLLRDDGVIFISINDYEVDNLRKLCNEIFGEDNSLTESPTTLIWQQSGTTAGHFANAHEYILAFAKNKSTLPFFGLSDYGEDSSIIHGALKKISKSNPASEITFPAGIEYAGDSAAFQGEVGGSEKQYIDGLMVFKDGKLDKPVTIKAGWAMKEQVLSWLNGEETYDTKGQRVIKFFFNKEGILWYEKERGTLHPKTVIPKELGTTKTGSTEITDIFSSKVMDFPKPSSLIKWLCSFVTKDNDIILDYFSGSATTAHAVLDLNKDDKCNRKFILVQLPEPCADDTEAFKAGYKTIADIGKERIRRVIEKIENGKKQDVQGTLLEASEKNLSEVELDLGFKVFKLDISNFKQWQKLESSASAEEIEKQLLLHVDHVNHKATPEDLLYEILIKAGFTPTEKIETKSIAGQNVFSVAEGSLLLCLDETITKELIDAVAEHEPMQFICLDSAFHGNDQLKTNAVQTFAARNMQKEKHNQIIFRTV